MKLKDYQLDALKWIKENQPVGFFNPKTGPSLRLTKKLVELGLVERKNDLLQHPDIECAGVSLFELSKPGKQAIKNSKKGN